MIEAGSLVQIRDDATSNPGRRYAGRTGRVMGVYTQPTGAAIYEVRVDGNRVLFKDPAELVELDE